MLRPLEALKMFYYNNFTGTVVGRGKGSVQNYIIIYRFDVKIHKIKNLSQNVHQFVLVAYCGTKVFFVYGPPKNVAKLLFIFVCIISAQLTTEIITD